MIPISNYKSKIASRYIPVDSEQIGLKIAESDYYLASIKYDGHLAILSVNNGSAELFDGSGKSLNIPSILDLAKKLPDNMVLAGELCCFVNDACTTHREVNSALAHPDDSDLRFGVFDILEYRGESVPTDPQEKANLISGILPGGKIFCIEQKYFESRKDIIAFFKEHIDTAEGVVVRSSNGIIYKIKPVHTLDLVLLGYAEGTGDRAGMLREILLGFAFGENNFQIVTKCGGGFSDKDRQELPKRFESMAVPSEYTEVSGAKTGFIMVKPELVVEISCLDLINESSGGAIRKALLSYDSNLGYTNQGNKNTLSIISPNFVRFRDDKQANPQDAGVLQAYDIVEPFSEGSAADADVDSSIVFREVFIKSGKGGTAVRKFVGLKTNKEQSNLFAPYVLVYSDYSGGRKSPLDQDLFLCSSEAELQEKLLSLKAENIKKGWEGVN